MSKKESTVFVARADHPNVQGQVNVGDGETLDVGRELEKGNGSIVVDAGSPEEHALDGFPGLRRGSAGDTKAEKSAGKE